MFKEAVGVKSPVDHARNGKLRKFAEKPVNRIAQGIHRSAPRVSPHHVSLVGLGLVVAGTRIAEREWKRETPRKKVLVGAAALKAAGYSLDAVDGALARAKNADAGSKHNGKIGNILDNSVDRAQETDAGLSHARTAANSLGEWAGRSVAISCILPSWARAYVETQGKVVPENGGSIFQAIGTRPWRVVLDIASTFVPPNARTGIDILSTSANLNTTFNRLREGAKVDGEVVLNAEEIHQAKVRQRVLEGQLAVTGVAVGVSVWNGRKR